MSYSTTVASEVQALNLSTSTTSYYIPVAEAVLTRILQAMLAVGIEWDSTVNQIDDFYSQTRCSDWNRLTPNRRGARVVYIQYVV